jgi:hypothetical protein
MLEMKNTENAAMTSRKRALIFVEIVFRHDAN